MNRFRHPTTGAKAGGLFATLLILAATLGPGRANAAPVLSQAAITPGKPVAFSTLVGKQARNFVLYAPAQWSPTRATPIVFVLHGGGGNPLDMMRSTGFADQAEKSGFVAVVPEGMDHTWNAGRCCGSAVTQKIDDVGFFKQMLGQLSKVMRVDPDRIYATGISNGGMMVYRLACEMSDTFAAIAPVAASLEVPTCAAGYPISVLHYHGTNDKNVPFDGGVGADAIYKVQKRSVPDSLAVWQAKNSCQPAKTLKQVGDTTYLGAACPKAEVVLAKIAGGGHAWPGGTPPSFSGDTSSAYVKATPEIASFFSAHAKAR